MHAGLLYTYASRWSGPILLKCLDDVLTSCMVHFALEATQSTTDTEFLSHNYPSHLIIPVQQRLYTANGNH